jgi:TetR/AcrR family acrAB operon transcriptional repressor
VVRRTKEEALATRHALLDAAEHLFQQRGVSRTTLNDIAQAAGLTRGAIYWHFKDKADLFNAMMERVTLPMEESLQRLDESDDPLVKIRSSMTDALLKVIEDPQARRVFDIAMNKVEYVDEMEAVKERHLSARDECVAHLQDGLRVAARQRGVKLPVPHAIAAHGLHAMIDGLIQNWLLSPGAFDLVVTSKRALDTYLAGLGLADSGEDVRPVTAKVIPLRAARR